MDLAVDINGVVKRYAGHVAVRDLSLKVPRGAVYGLLGPNGAGKTTTIRMILNIIAPDEGTIEVLGQRNSRSGVLDRIGYLPEERGLYKKMQVRRLLKFLGALKGVSAKDADRRIDIWMERLSLRSPEKDWGNAKVDELSRGMQQKVQFIGALLHEPELVILDEPFSGLDPINAQALKDTVVELKRDGRTIIFSTHLMDSAERLCDAVCIIARGTKVLDGPIEEVRAEHGGTHVALALGGGSANGVGAVLNDPRLIARLDDSNRFFEIELTTGADPQLLLRRLVEAGASIQRFELVRPSLHQIFLQKVGAKGIEAGMTELTGGWRQATGSFSQQSLRQSHEVERLGQADLPDDLPLERDRNVRDSQRSGCIGAVHNHAHFLVGIVQPPAQPQHALRAPQRRDRALCHDYDPIGGIERSERSLVHLVLEFHNAHRESCADGIERHGNALGVTHHGCPRPCHGEGPHAVTLRDQSGVQARNVEVVGVSHRCGAVAGQRRRARANGPRIQLHERDALRAERSKSTRERRRDGRHADIRACAVDRDDQPARCPDPLRRFLWRHTRGRCAARRDLWALRPGALSLSSGPAWAAPRLVARATIGKREGRVQFHSALLEATISLALRNGANQSARVA